MKENLRAVLFIASIALNAIFAVRYVAYKLPSLAGVQQATSRGPLFLQLDLTPDQLTRFKGDRERFHAQLQELGQQIKAKQIEIIDLLGTAPTDQQAIERKQQEIQHLQGEVQDRVIVHFLQESSHMSSEQRARFFRLVKARIETGVQTCPPWMKSLGQGQPGASRNE